MPACWEALLISNKSGYGRVQEVPSISQKGDESMEERNWSRSLVMWAVFLLVLASCPAQAQEKKLVRISGAGLLSEVVQTMSEDFTKENPSCSFTVSGATTGIGFQKLLDGQVEVAMLTRKVTSEEAKLAEAKGVQLSSKLIGKIGLAVITNTKNSVNVLTMDQLAKIYKGEITNWSQVGGLNEQIKVTTRAVPETGAGVLFQRVVLEGAPYSKDAQIMSSYNNTLAVCGKSFAIGYIPTTTVHFDKLSQRGAKIIKIKKDANSEPYQLSAGMARETLYPISVNFYLYWNAKQKSLCTDGFAEFCEKQTQ
jgi:phosphate transport system substrate-binding protein